MIYLIIYYLSELASLLLIITYECLPHIKGLYDLKEIAIMAELLGMQLKETFKSQGKDENGDPKPKKRILSVPDGEFNKFIEDKFGITKKVRDSFTEMYDAVAKDGHKVLVEFVKEDGQSVELRAGSRIVLDMTGKKESRIPSSDKKKVTFGGLNLKIRSGSIPYLKGDSDEFKDIVSQVEKGSKNWK